MADTTRARAKLLENWQVLEASNLYHNQNGRDAVYALYLYREQNNAARGESAFRVRSDWGKRNTALQTTLKPAFPTVYNRALDIYNTLRKEKLREGYRASSATAPRLMQDGARAGSYAIMGESMLRQDNPTSAFMCPRCKAPFGKEDEYLAHMEWHDRKDDEKQREEQKRQASGLRLGTGLAWGCQYCDRKFSAKTLLEMHVRAVHEQAAIDNLAAGSFKCNVCGASFRSLNGLAQHGLLHVAGSALPNPKDIVLPNEKPSLTRKATRKIILDD